MSSIEDNWWAIGSMEESSISAPFSFSRLVGAVLFFAADLKKENKALI